MHAKNQVDLSILTLYLLDSGILQSDLLIALLTLPNQKGAGMTGLKRGRRDKKEQEWLG